MVRTDLPRSGRTLDRRQPGRAAAAAVSRRRACPPSTAGFGAGAGRFQPGHHDGAACRLAPRGGAGGDRRLFRPVGVAARWQSRNPCRRDKVAPAGAARSRRSRRSDPAGGFVPGGAGSCRARRRGRMAFVERNRPRHRRRRPAPRRGVSGATIFGGDRHRRRRAAAGPASGAFSLPWLSFRRRVRDATQAKLRHHHRRRRFRRLHAGKPADRGRGNAGPVARSRRLGSRSVDQDPARPGRGCLAQRKHNWMYFCEPEAATGGRGLECARGCIVGGTSSINAMAYVRGHQGDYDRWAASGLAGWSYADVLPYFRRQESWKGGAKLLSRRRRPADDADDDIFRSAGRRFCGRRTRCRR